MANSEHVSLLKRGVDTWNAWRAEHPLVKPDLAGAMLRDVYLSGSDLTNADLTGADVSGAQLVGARLLDAQLRKVTLARADLQHAFLARADLWEASLCGANLNNTNLRYVNAGSADFREARLISADAWFGLFSHANFAGANLDLAEFRNAHLFRADLRETNLVRTSFNTAWLDEADLRGAKCADTSFDSASLRSANLSGMNLSGVNLSADLIDTDLSHANLRGATLTGMLIRTDLRHANLSGCRVYGVSAWDVQLEGADQTDLIITPTGGPSVTVDDLEVAQFVYLLLNNEKLRQIIDTVTSKMVLILGRFSDERKPVLDAVRSELRRLNFTPVIFDFDRPAKKDVTGTVELLARMAGFIVADITDPSSIPHELATVVPFLRTTPVIPIRLAGSGGYSMFEDLGRAYKWVLPIREYKDSPSLMLDLPKVIATANEVAARLR